MAVHWCVCSHRTLQNNAFSIIAHGICVAPDQFHTTDLMVLLQEVIEVDIARYGEYQDIYDRVLCLQGAMHRSACSASVNLDIVAAIKATKHLRKSLNRYSRSSTCLSAGIQPLPDTDRRVAA